MRTTLSIGLLAVLAGFAQAEEKKDEFKAKCPVSGKPAEKGAKIVEEGSTLYFCCENCPTDYKKDPKKYAAKANYQLAVTKQIKQIACPISGKELDKEQTGKVGDVEVAYCCSDCLAKVKKEKEDKQIEMVFKDVKKSYKKAE